MAYKGVQYTITATATPLSRILGVSPDTGLFSFDIIGVGTMAASGFVGNSGVTNVPANAGGVFTATQGFSQGPFQFAAIRAGDVFVVGTASDVAAVSANL